MPDASIRILIADDHPIFRDGLRRLLQDEPGFEVVGEAGDGPEAVRLSLERKPDVLLLDLAMPRASGLDVLRDLSASAKPIKTILLTVAVERDQVLEAVRLGARGIVLKETATANLLKAIRGVMAGEYWIGRDSVGDLVESWRAPAAREDARPAASLTVRERDVIGVVAAGCSNKEIAARFSISEDTVKHHLTNIFDKVGVSSRLELAVYALQNRLVKHH